MHSLILCRSLTTAQKAARVLQGEGIFAAVTKAPQSAHPDGCGYGVKIAERRRAEALEALALAGVPVRGVVELPEAGERGERR